MSRRGGGGGGVSAAIPPSANRSDSRNPIEEVGGKACRLLVCVLVFPEIGGVAGWVVKLMGLLLGVAVSVECFGGLWVSRDYGFGGDHARELWS